MLRSRVARVLHRRGAGIRVALVVAIVAVSAPVLVECGTRLADHWEPIGDDAMVAVLSYDVLSHNSSSHGMPSTLRTEHDQKTFYHPGPLLFWLLAVPTRATGGAGDAIAITTAAIQVAAIASLALLVRRRVGLVGALLALCSLAIVELALGRSMLDSPLNTYAVLLPFAAFLAAAWVAALGDDVALPFAVFFGSLAALSHDLFLPLVFAVGVTSLAMYLRHRPRRTATGQRTSGWERAGVLVLVISWSPVLWDATAYFPGNLWSSIVGGGSHSRATIGVGNAFAAVFNVAAQVDLWRSAAANHRGLLYVPVSFGAVAIALAGGVLVVGAARRDRRVRCLALLMAAALIALVVTVAELPSPEFLDLSGVRDRVIYVIGAAYLLLLFVSAYVVMTRARARVPSATKPAAVAVGVVLVVSFGLVAATRPSPADGYLPVFRDQRQWDAVRQLAAAKTKLDRRRVYVMDNSFDSFAIERGVLWDLYRHGYRIRVAANDPYLGERHPSPAGPVDHLAVHDGTSPPVAGAVVLAQSDIYVRQAGAALARLHDSIVAEGHGDLLRSLDARGAPLVDVPAVVQSDRTLSWFAPCPSVVALIVRGTVGRDEPVATQLCQLEGFRTAIRKGPIVFSLEPSGSP